MRTFPTNLNILPALFIALSLCAVAVAAGPDREAGRVLVTNVFDGDTIAVELGARQVTIRLIGVDTPETSRPEHPVEFYGPEATEFTRRSLEGKQVRLEFEAPGRPGGEKDKYGRLLAYVFTEDGKNFNLELVRLGYGRAYTKYPFKYQRDFITAEKTASQSGRGMWDRMKREAWSDPRNRGTVIGNIGSHIYHLPGQEGYDKVLEKNRIYFRNEEDARNAGFRRARK